MLQSDINPSQAVQGMYSSVRTCSANLFIPLIRTCSNSFMVVSPFWNWWNTWSEFYCKLWGVCLRALCFSCYFWINHWDQHMAHEKYRFFFQDSFSAMVLSFNLHHFCRELHADVLRSGRPCPDVCIFFHTSFFGCQKPFCLSPWSLSAYLVCLPVKV